MSCATLLLWRIDRHEADADAGLEQAVAPAEAEAGDHLAQLLRDLARLGQVAVRHQHAELVAAEAPERVVGAQLGLQQRAELPQQLVARGVPAGVVHHLELVEVEEHERMAARVELRVLERLAELALELAAVDEPGQRVVARLPGELVVERPRPRNVRVHEIADAQHPAEREQQHAEQRHLAVVARHRRHAVERHLHLDGAHQPVHLEHLARLHPATHSVGERLRARFERVVAVHARLAHGRVGPHVAQRAHAVDGLDAPYRIPGDRRLRGGLVLRLELRPGPALEVVRKALVGGEVPFAHRPVAVESAAVDADALAHQLEELRRERHVAALLLVALGGHADPVARELADHVLGVDRPRARGLPRDDLGELHGLELDQALLAAFDEIAGQRDHRR